MVIWSGRRNAWKGGGGGESEGEVVGGVVIGWREAKGSRQGGEYFAQGRMCTAVAAIGQVASYEHGVGWWIEPVEVCHRVTQHRCGVDASVGHLPLGHHVQVGDLREQHGRR